MDKVSCIYCGAQIPAESECCPACSAPSHFQQRGFRAGAKQRLLVYFALLAAVCLLLALILPR